MITVIEGAGIIMMAQDGDQGITTVYSEDSVYNTIGAASDKAVPFEVNERKTSALPAAAVAIGTGCAVGGALWSLYEVAMSGEMAVFTASFIFGKIIGSFSAGAGMALDCLELAGKFASLQVGQPGMYISAEDAGRKRRG